MDNAVASADVETVKATCVKLKAEGLEPDQIRGLLERTIRCHAITRMGYAPASLPLSDGDEQQSVEAVERFLLFVIALAKSEQCIKTLTVQVLQDIFDVSVVKRCENLFSIVENHIGVWKEPFFFDACKNLILRMSNDLLKRLSRTVDTNFCGRILILLAKSLPLNEKSGLNLSGHFNTANVTAFERETKREEPEAPTSATKVEEEHDASANRNSTVVENKDVVSKAEDVDMEVGEIREEHSAEPTTSTSSNPPLDSQLYSQFWEIQTHLSNPPSLLQDPATLKRFESNLLEVLRIFTSYKLEQQSSKADGDSGSGGGRDRRREATNSTNLHPGYQTGTCSQIPHPVQNGTGGVNSIHPNGDTACSNDVEMKPAVLAKAEPETEDEDTFFAKYLTNHKLFNLQLADSQFRRYFLLQCLIVTNHLLHCKSQPQPTTTTTTVKLKETNIAPASQPSSESSLKEIADKCAALLKETYPRGGHFSDCVKKILNREKMWANWKGEGCPDLPTAAAQLEVLLFKKKPQVRHDPRIINLGNKELTRLWNINPDNLDACRDKKRDSAPDLIKFLEEGLDQQDPEQQVEEQYKLINDERYQWMASRFLLHNSEHYMNSVVSDVKTARPSGAKYLERAILNTALAIPELKERALKIQSAQQRIEEEKAAKAAEERALQEEEQRAKAELDEKRRAKESNKEVDNQHDSKEQRAKHKAGDLTDTPEEKATSEDKESVDTKERPKSKVDEVVSPQEKKRSKEADNQQDSKEQRARVELDEKRRTKESGREGDNLQDSKEQRVKAELDEKRRVKEDNHERSKSKESISKERLKRRANSDPRDEKDSTDRGRDFKESTSKDRLKRTRHQ